MDILVIRHGQSHNNHVWATTGGSVGRLPDPPLTELGHQQAARLADAFASGRYAAAPAVLYSSLMARAVQTAAPIADALDIDLHGHLEAFEVGGPLDWDGHPDTARRHHRGAGASELTALSARLRLPEGVSDQGWWAGPVEPAELAADRARRLVAGLRERHGGSDDVVGVVCHEWFAQYLFRELLGIAQMGGWVTVSNTGVSWFREPDGPDDAVVATWVNRVDHLRPDQLSG